MIYCMNAFKSQMVGQSQYLKDVVMARVYNTSEFNSQPQIVKEHLAGPRVSPVQNCPVRMMSKTQRKMTRQVEFW